MAPIGYIVKMSPNDYIEIKLSIGDMAKQCRQHAWKVRRRPIRRSSPHPGLSYIKVFLPHLTACSVLALHPLIEGRADDADGLAAI